MKYHKITVNQNFKTKLNYHVQQFLLTRCHLIVQKKWKINRIHNL